MSGRLNFPSRRTPIPRMDRETEATRSGPVKTYRLSEEELAASRERARKALEAEKRAKPWLRLPVGVTVPLVSKTRLKRLLEQKSLSAIARRMGVTTSMVRKWVEYYDLDMPKRSNDDIRPGYIVAEADPSEEEET